MKKLLCTVILTMCTICVSAQINALPETEVYEDESFVGDF